MKHYQYALPALVLTFGLAACGTASIPEAAPSTVERLGGASKPAPSAASAPQSTAASQLPNSTAMTTQSHAVDRIPSSATTPSPSAAPTAVPIGVAQPSSAPLVTSVALLTTRAPIAPASPLPQPPATPAERIIRLAVGEIFQLPLGDAAGWKITIADQRIIAPAPPGTTAATQAYQALAPGTTGIVATRTACGKASLHCQSPTIIIHLTVIVQ